MENLFFKIDGGALTYGGQLTYRDERYIIVAEGDIRLENKNITLDEVARYVDSGGDIADLDGLYSMIVYDVKAGKLIAMQDIFAYIHPLYYALSDGGICVALYLKQVIVESGIKARLDSENIAEFLYNGFLTDDRCLIKGVKKVPAMHVMHYDVRAGTADCVKRAYSVDAIAGDERDYAKILESNLGDIVKSGQKINMALSSGFDSNFILDCINRTDPGRQINAYTVGAANGNDETQSVLRICGCHPEVRLVAGQVTPDVLQSLPQIVYELEDSVFERGIFLQYVMCGLLSADGVDALILGEGADQILSSEFRTAAEKYYFVGKEEHYPWVYYPYEMLTYIILKKNGIFLRNRDIRAIYPFIKGNFIRGVSGLRALNGTDKGHYKSYVAGRVKREVGGLLIKRPGSTNLSTLIDDGNKNLPESARQSEFYHMLPVQPDRDSGTEVELDNCLKVLYLIVFEELFCNGGAETLKNKEIKITLNALLENIARRKAE